MSGRAVLVRLFAVFKGRSGMLLRFFMLAYLVVMRGLVMVMHGGVVVGGCMVMMLTRLMLRLVRHICSSMGIERFVKPKRSGSSFSD